MRKLSVLFILILIPILAMANSYYFGYHPLKAKHHAQMQNNRAYRLLEKTQQYWSYANLVWMEDMNFEYYYESNTTASPDTVRFLSWNYNSNTYQLVGTYHFTYDATGEYVTHMVLTNTSGAITNTYMEAFMNYTPQGYLIGYQLYMPGGTGSLELNSTMQIDYTSTSNYEIWDWVAQNEDLVPEWRHTTFEWDTPGRITMETIQTSTDSVSWVNYEQISHTYHAGDTTTGDSFVSGFSHQLPLMMIGDYNGPFYGKELESYTKSWNNNQWVNRYKQNFDYNANLVLLSDIEYKWQGAAWINKGKNDYIYDANNNLTEDVYCIWSSNTWINDIHYVYDYSAYTANSDPTTVPVLMNLSAYPNPFHQSDAVTFKTKLSVNETGTITIYNLKGQIVKTLPVKAGSSQLVWNSNQRNCAAGVYLYRLSTNKHEVTKKLVILN